MRRIVQNKVYDTDTAKYIGTNTVSGTRSLYRKVTGEYFIYDKELPGSKAILPMDYTVANDWAKKNLSKEDYKRHFKGTDNKKVRTIIEFTPDAYAVLQRLRGIDKTNSQVVSDLLLEQNKRDKEQGLI